MGDEGAAAPGHTGVPDGHDQGLQGARADHLELRGPGGPFPRSGKRDDLRALATIFRTPYCSYPQALLHGLQALGLPYLPPAHLACEAAHIRYAMQAQDIWRPQAVLLRQVREEHLALAHAFGATPEPGWSMKAMAFLLEEAWCRGDALGDGVAHGGAAEDEPSENAAPRAARRGAHSFQHAIYVKLCVRELVTPMSVALTPRVIACVSLFSAARPDVGVATERIDTCIRSLKTGAGIFSLFLSRTWCNAWATSQRLQKGCGPCAWGCSPAGRDSLAHLLRCPVLWAAVEARLHVSLADPMARIGLGGDRPQAGGGPPLSVLGISLAVQAYHRRQDRVLSGPDEGARWAAAEVEGAYRQLSVLR